MTTVDGVVDAFCSLVRGAIWVAGHRSRGRRLVGRRRRRRRTRQSPRGSEGTRSSSSAMIDTFFPGEHRHLWSNRWWKYKSMLQPGALADVGHELRLDGPSARQRRLRQPRATAASVRRVRRCRTSRSARRSVTSRSSRSGTRSSSIDVATRALPGVHDQSATDGGEVAVARRRARSTSWWRAHRGFDSIMGPGGSMRSPTTSPADSSAEFGRVRACAVIGDPSVASGFVSGM